MPKRKHAPKAKPHTNTTPDTDAYSLGPDDGVSIDMTPSQALAAAATRSVLAAGTVKAYSGNNPEVEVSDLTVELRKVSKEVSTGKLDRLEGMLVHQAIALDAMFTHLAQRSHRQQNLSHLEAFMRLAFKAQAQSRATVEALAMLKNPRPYIRQANIAHGHQQVNNGCTPELHLNAGTHKGTHTNLHTAHLPSLGQGHQSSPSKLLEADNGNILDTGAKTTTGRADTKLETVGKVHRAKNAGRQNEGGIQC